MVKRFGTVMVVVNLTVAFFSLTDMYLLASGAIKVDYPDEGGFNTALDPVNLELVFQSEYRITNRGFYDLEGISIFADLYTKEGKLLIDYRTTDLRVPRFSSRTFPIEARLPIQRALNMDLKEALFDGATFVLKVRIEAAYVMGLVHFHLDQVRDYPWEAPLPQYKEMFENGSLLNTIAALLGGNYTTVIHQIETALVKAFLAQGTEAKVPLNKWAELSITTCDEGLLVRVYLIQPIQAMVFEYTVPLEDLSQGGEAP